MRRGTDRERSHVEAVARHVAGDSAPLVAHLRRHPTDALLLSVAVPTIAFAGVTTVPQDAWEIVERCAPAYGDDWWFTGLLAFMRQEQGRFDEAMELSRLSLDIEPGAGHSAHARAHAHYETGDHTGGLAWMDGWITGAGAQVDSLCHFSWHAAMHELSLGDLDAVRVRYDTQLRPEPGMGCRSLVDSGSLLWRWALTPGSRAVPGIDEVLAVVDESLLTRPQSPFMAMHAAVALCAAEDASGLATLARSCASRTDLTHVEVTAPLALALRRLVLGDPSGAADAIAAVEPRAVAGRRERRPARGRRGDQDLRADQGRPVRRGADRHRPAPGPAALPPRRVVPDPGSADGDLVALDGDLLRRQRRLSRTGDGEPSLIEKWLLWHGQTISPPSTLDTVQPWCVQTAVNALKSPLVGWVTTTFWSARTVPPPSGTSDVATVAPPDAPEPPEPCRRPSVGAPAAAGGEQRQGDPADRQPAEHRPPVQRARRARGLLGVAHAAPCVLGSLEGHTRQRGATGT